MENKKCKQCNREFELSTQYFFKNSQRKDGFRNKCRECSGHKFKDIDKKTCNKCKNTYPKNENYFRIYKSGSSMGQYYHICLICEKEYKNSKEYKEYQKYYSKVYQEENKLLLKIKKKEYYEENKEQHKIYKQINKKRIKEYMNKYREINKDELKEWHNKYYLENKERIKKYKRESLVYRAYTKRQRESQGYKTYRAEYLSRQETKTIRALNEQKRRARKSQLPATLIREEWEYALNYFNRECCYCGCKESIEQEHFIPITQGGPFTKNNIVPACRSCNSSKRDSDFVYWYSKQTFYSEEKEKKIMKYFEHIEQ